MVEYLFLGMAIQAAITGITGYLRKRKIEPGQQIIAAVLLLITFIIVKTLIP